MTLNGSGIRDIARVRHISPTTVIETLKKEPAIQAVNHPLVSPSRSEPCQVTIEKVDAAEMDEMWSYVQHKGQQRWLWHAIDHQCGAV
jgi:insertion element IS1 protein InsB